MKASHVQARIDKRGDMRCVDDCPGWIAATSRAGHPRLVACAACNDLHLARLQVTDAMVRLLPLARAGLAVVTRQIASTRRERAITRHAFFDVTYGALCGHSLGPTKSGRRRHVVSSGTNCTECLRLVAMTPAERDAEQQARSAELAYKFKAKRDETMRARAQQDTDTEARVAAARVEARIALDVLEDVGFDHEKIAQTSRLELVAETLAMAVTAHRHANRASRGERRWVFRSDALHGERMQSTHRQGVTRNVRCRFCDAVLLAEGKIGTDYTRATDGHTVRCALEYLAGKLPITDAEMEA